eukprot:290804-Chlamydomonas_euryale.AAC.3
MHVACHAGARAFVASLDMCLGYPEACIQSANPPGAHKARDTPSGRSCLGTLTPRDTHMPVDTHTPGYPCWLYHAVAACRWTKTSAEFTIGGVTRPLNPTFDGNSVTVTCGGVQVGILGPSICTLIPCTKRTRAQSGGCTKHVKPTTHMKLEGLIKESAPYVAYAVARMVGRVDLPQLQSDICYSSLATTLFGLVHSLLSQESITGHHLDHLIRTNAAATLPHHLNRTNAA